MIDEMHFETCLGLCSSAFGIPFPNGIASLCLLSKQSSPIVSPVRESINGMYMASCRLSVRQKN